jgi:hypothetical protein
MLSGLYSAHKVTIMASQDTNMSKQRAVGKRKHETLTIPKKLEIIRGLKVAQAAVWSRLHKTLACQPSMT